MLATPIGVVAGVMLLYGALALGGMSEREGRRGLTAGLYGIAPGAAGGFFAGWSLAKRILSGTDAAARGLEAGVATAALLGIVAGFMAWIAGVRLAESRGVPNEAGRRNVWSLWRAAIPTAAIGGAGGFLLGRWLAG